MALLLSIMMVLASVPALAADTTGAPTSGSITVNSPVVGATYKAYKIFDMTTNKDVDAFSYTIDANSPFYGAVVEYANDTSKGLSLARIKDSNPATYNVIADETKFKAQDFGKAMQKALTDGAPAVTADAAETAKAGTGIVAKEAVAAATVDAPVATKTCETSTDDTSDYIKFEDLALGYFLINPTYPPATAVTVKLGEGANEKTFTDEHVTKDANGVVTGLNTVGEALVDEYVTATVTDEYVNKYIKDHGIATNKDGSPLNDAGKAAYKADLGAALKADAIKKIVDAFNDNAANADLNVKEPILVFLDSSQPDATINEKNEIDKWDVPVNPTADTNPDTPDHGEPEGGKNIIVQEATDTTPAYSADWSEAEIGESVHYQLRVNAMNFIRTGETDATIQQVKEYFLADYQSGHMEFDKSKGLHVSVWQGDNANNSQASTGTKNVTKNPDGTVAADGFLDYTDYATGENGKTAVFFKNNSTQDANPAPTDVFGNNGTGIMVPWVKVVDPTNPALTDEQLNALKAQFPIYTITNVPVEGEFETEEFKDGDPNTEGVQKVAVKEQKNGEWVEVEGKFVSVNNHIVDANGNLLDENGNKIQKTKPIYTFSLYNSDVTIVVDYWMILKDNAIVDEPGNKNYAQYGWSPVDNENEDHTPKTPTNPSDEDKPSQKEKVDDATVYTFAIAWVKVDEQGKELADAEFELPFYVKKAMDGDAYVYAFETLPETFAEGDSAANYTNKVKTTSETAVITIKGVEQGKYSITETEAPVGYNKLTAPFEVEAKKSGPAVTTKTKTIIYLDADGNVTDEVTTSTIEYVTHEDSYNTSSATSPEETSVPVYQFDPVVNKQGTELPATGGVGTTIFYVAGSILVLAAAILLITKRRMGAND